MRGIPQASGTTRILAFSVPDELVFEIDEIERRHGRINLSEVIRELLQKWVDEQRAER